jgi:aldose 1-epimerase
MPPPRLPVDASGDQIVMTGDRLRLTVVTAGGGMRELTCGEWSVLDGYHRDEVPPGAAGQPLIPWPNRLAGGRYEFGGRRYQVPLTEPEKRNALHGFARWMTWHVDRHDTSSAVLSLMMYPRQGYPFALYVEVEYRVYAMSVSVTTRALNVGRTPLPYASGFHPYITAGTPAVDNCVLTVSRLHVAASRRAQDPDRTSRGRRQRQRLPRRATDRRRRARHRVHRSHS